MDAYVEGEETNQSLCYITCQMNQVSALEYGAISEFTLVLFSLSKTAGWKASSLGKRAYFAKIFVEYLALWGPHL